MKITLDASIKEHREIAELFRYGLVSYPCFDEMHIGSLIGIKFNNTLVRFVVNSHLQSKITIDLDQAQMDLRMAIGTGIEFRLPHYTPNRILRTANFSEGVNVFNFNQFFGIDADKIKLCLDYLISVGVEVEE